MSAETKRPNVAAVLSRLKDFQRATADHAFHRLYIADDSSHRFLVADEVGLGKTVVARGVIVKMIDHLWDTVGRIDVIYVCSNADIARQNVNRLNVMDSGGFSSGTRLTMLPLELSGLRENKVNFVSFTPGTSFDMKGGTGLARERALIYSMVRSSWNLGNSAAPVNVFKAYAGADRFRDAIAQIDDRRRYPKGIDAGLLADFASALSKDAHDARQIGRPSLHDRFEALCRVFSRSDRQPSADQTKERNLVVGELRHLLANTCIRSLEPDLVILDEFQRFKEILSGEGEAAELARELFTYSNDHSAARVLLLSATPYKMYTVREEGGDDDHYSDFVETLRFLQRDVDSTDAVAQLLADMRRAIYRGTEGRDTILRLRAQIETALRRVMARTERLAVSPDRGGMLREVPARDLSLRPDDARTYCAVQRIGRELDQPDTVEFWKSAPYLLNFMDGYKLKERFDASLETGGDGGKAAGVLRTAMRSGTPVALSIEQIEAQEPVQPPHPRMRWMLKDVVDRGAWRLLWIPPSLPYYRMEGPFADSNLSRFTKRLVFSAWRVAPKAIATLVSYEAERHMLAGARKEKETRREQLDRTKALLNFARSSGRLTGMTVLGLLYPSIVLARTGDPLHYEINGGATGFAPLDVVLQNVEDRLSKLLAPITAAAEATAAVDEAWYWAAPILLDLQEHPVAARGWLDRTDLAIHWSGDDEEDGEESIGWSLHVARARELVESGEHGLGTPPPDLARVCAEIAIGGPAVCALRALSRSKHAAECLESDEVRDAAANVAHGFRALFNLPEVISLVRGMMPEEPYWRRTMQYSANGCLQSVLDEYVHVMQSWEGVAEQDVISTAAAISVRIREALGIRVSLLGIDDISIAGNGRVVRKAARMRARFAMRFGDERSDDGSEGNRKEHVRTAFNSPFWPFVLASTSVGQEGLDFHLYCHAVVHWNVPPNPVDMEQREGRVHRFKGHAVRRNVAARFGRELGSDGAEDPWAALFDLAVEWRDAGSSDLEPYWVFPLEKGASIERHVPNLPFSRDAAQYAALRRSLAVYRMVFGQPRQDDLLDYLMSQGIGGSGIEAEELRIDLTPPAR